MLAESLMLSVVIGIGVALLACRLSEWLPLHIEQQESELITEIIETHAASSKAEAIKCPETRPAKLLQWPGLSAANVACGAFALFAVLGAVYASPTGLHALLWSLWSVGLIVLAFVDARTKLLPDALTLPLMWLGILIQLWPETRSIGLEFSVIGAVAGYLPLWLLTQIYRVLRGRDGLGMGDLKLLAAMGAWSGPWLLPQVLLLAALLVIAVYVLERVLHRSTAGIYEERPFGPAIVAAYFIVLVLLISLG